MVVSDMNLGDGAKQHKFDGTMSIHDEVLSWRHPTWGWTTLAGGFVLVVCVCLFGYADKDYEGP